MHQTVNILHGDLKPSNILIRDKMFKLCDFGASLKLDENKRRDFDDYVTTEPFMPPEAVKYLYDEPIEGCDDYLSPKSDMWHLGLCIFEALTLMTPHFAAVDSELQDVDSEDEDYSEAWDTALRGMIGRRPALPHWIDQQVKTRPEYKTVFDLFIACTGTAFKYIYQHFSNVHVYLVSI